MNSPNYLPCHPAPIRKLACTATVTDPRERVRVFPIDYRYRPPAAENEPGDNCSTGKQRVRNYTQAEIDDLIGCPKLISDPPKREMRTENNQKRNDMRLRSETGDRDYRAFIRIRAEFSENFSIGLVYLPKDGSGEITLLRCNGPHGEFNDRFDPAHPHSEFTSIAPVRKRSSPASDPRNAPKGARTSPPGRKRWTTS